MATPALREVDPIPPGTSLEPRYTEAQLAILLDKSINTLRRWRREGTLPFHRYRKAIWFTREDIETFERRSAVDHGRRPAR